MKQTFKLMFILVLGLFLVSCTNNEQGKDEKVEVNINCLGIDNDVLTFSISKKGECQIKDVYLLDENKQVLKKISNDATSVNDLASFKNYYLKVNYSYEEKKEVKQNYSLLEFSSLPKDNPFTWEVKSVLKDNASVSITDVGEKIKIKDISLYKDTNLVKKYDYTSNLNLNEIVLKELSNDTLYKVVVNYDFYITNTFKKELSVEKTFCTTNYFLDTFLYIIDSGSEIAETGRDEIVITGLKNTDLEEIVIPDGVTIDGKYYIIDEIKGQAFNNSKLKKVTIGRNISIIHQGSFLNNTNLEEIVFEKRESSNPEISIDMACFKNCNKLVKVDLSMCNGVTISANAFEGCTSLKEVSLGINTMYLRDNAFKDCTSLEKINNTSALISIGSNAFLNCNNLLEVYLGDKVDTIGSHAFSNCPKLVLKTSLKEAKENWSSNYKDESIQIIFDVKLS